MQRIGPADSSGSTWAFVTRTTAAIVLLSVASATSAASAVALGTEPPTGGWRAAVGRQIGGTEYAITWQARTSLADLQAAYQAPNRAHGLRTYFTPQGIRVVPREESIGSSWEWVLALRGVGRAAAMLPTEPAGLRADGNRIEYERSALLEWYVNDEKGLEQGFVVRTRPVQRDAGAPVIIELDVNGTLSAFPSQDGQWIEFKTSQGVPVLRYGSLRVSDATGRELPAHMETLGATDGPRVRLVFSDEGAAYPVTVDPLATSPAWTMEGNQDGAEFGVSVATAGDVNGDGYSDVIVGAFFYDNGQTNEGRAYVFLGSAAGLATTPSWTAEGDQNSSRFGFSVATAGDVNGDGYSDVIVGAYGYDSPLSDEGQARVYLGSASGLAASPSWTAHGNQASAFFGVAVATAGDVNGDGYSDVVVGAMFYDNGQTDEGQVFVYHGSAAGLSPTASWMADGDRINANLGVSVATAGDVNGDGYADLIVGADRYGPLNSDQGAAFIYHGSAAGLGLNPARTLSIGEMGAHFGNSVATAGDVDGDGYADVIVGAYHHTNGETEEGLVSVYKGSPIGVAAGAVWTKESDAPNTELGVSVGTAGDVNGDGYADIVVGAFHLDVPPGADTGGAYVYLGSATGPAPYAWYTTGGQAGSQYGISVGTAGDVNGDGYSDVIIGADLYSNGQAQEGRAYVYMGSGSGPGAFVWDVVGEDSDSQFGQTIAPAGDVNGDGYGDVIVGDYLFGSQHSGRVYGYYGAAIGLDTTPDWIVDGPAWVFELGNSVAGAGDVNGDGYSDVIVGAFATSNGEPSEGAALVYYGSAAGLQTNPAWSYESNQSGQELGSCVAGAGDVNGDGFADVIVGARSASSGVNSRVFVFQGSASGLAHAPAWTIEADESTDLGGTVASAGDVNRDGFSDVIVGAPNYTHGEASEGGASIYFGSAAGLSTLPSWTQEGDQINARFGASVASAGDVNGDGYADVVVGAPGRSGGVLPTTGQALVYYGSGSGVGVAPGWTIESLHSNTQFGATVGAAGDVNGDGYADVILGASDYTTFASHDGRVWVYFGSASGPSGAWSSQGSDSEVHLGTVVASAGDVNADGYSEVIASALRFGGVQRAFLYSGNGGMGLALRPEQRRVADAAPIDRLGAADDQNGFRLGLLARTPFGRGKVRLEWEVKPLSAPLDGTSTGISAVESDTGIAGAALGTLVSGLPIDTAYHWRMRLLYDSVTTPFASRSRWLTNPYGGWQEAKLRTAAPAAGSVPADDSSQATMARGAVFELSSGPLTVTKSGVSDLILDWGDSCNSTDTDYEIYAGTLGVFYSHVPVSCSTGGATLAALAVPAANTYYLVVPSNPYREGSYGQRSEGSERPRTPSVCRAQLIAACP